MTGIKKVNILLPQDIANLTFAMLELKAQTTGAQTNLSDVPKPTSSTTSTYTYT